MIGMTASMMTTAIAAPRPKSPPPRNIQSNIRLASTWLFHWPLVMVSTMSKTFSTRMVMVVQTTAIVPQICGIMIFKKSCQPLAPSMTAASIVSSGMPRSAADRMTMAKPVWIQIRITIRKKLFQNGSDDPHLRRSPPKRLHDGVQEADLGLAFAAILVDELPDDAGADEGDRQRQEDQALGDVAPPDAVGEEGDDQAEEGARAPARRAATGCC